MCRKRGKIVLVGVIGLQLNRTIFYEKELTFQVSCAYGPGRYDQEYEEKGKDYPAAYVRWTQQRNFEAVLDMMSSRSLDLDPLITHRFLIDDGAAAMELLGSDKPHLGIIIEYPEAVSSEKQSSQVKLYSGPSSQMKQYSKSVAFLGAGNYAGQVLIPAFKSAGAHLHSIISNSGISAAHFGRKYGFEVADTNSESILANDNINSVVIATRHDLHTEQVLGSLQAGKNVFCEKPLCLTLDELALIYKEASECTNQYLMVGFNRRFHPM